MKPTTLKELLKSPFVRGTGSDWQYLIYGTYNNSPKPLLRAYFHNFFGLKNDIKLFNEFCDFTTAALNEKWERDFGEPLRWKYSRMNNKIDCPVCGHLWFVDEEGVIWEQLKHCPSCGRRLLPPNEE